MSNFCLLCGSDSIKSTPTKDQKTYYACHQCHLTFVDPIYRPAPAEEKSRYLKHDNKRADLGYVRFLEKAILPSLQYLSPGQLILDYGCGPEPVLSQVLRDKYNLKADNYDPYFATSALKGSYHFIFSTETFEHFYNPAHELEKINRLLATKGYLCIMTQLLDSSIDFDEWWYRRDPTHVCFYKRQTLEYICAHWGMRLAYSDHRSVAILQKG